MRISRREKLNNRTIFDAIIDVRKRKREKERIFKDGKLNGFLEACSEIKKRLEKKKKKDELH